MLDYSILCDSAIPKCHIAGWFCAGTRLWGDGLPRLASLADTELGEDALQQIIGGGFPGDLAESVQNGT